MDAAANESRTVEPFGFVGLCLGLIGILGLAILATCLVAAVVAGTFILFEGWQAFMTAAKHVLLPSDTILATRALFCLIILFYLAVAGAVVLAARWRGGAAWRDLLAWRPFRLADKVIWAIMAATLLYSAGADALIGHFLPHYSTQLTIPKDPVALGELFVLAVMLAPMTEELVFRGWFYTGLRFHWGFWPALVLTAAMFAGAHYEGTHIYALAVFPIGLALAAIRERTHSVQASMVYHAINNLAAFCLSLLGTG